VQQSIFYCTKSVTSLTPKRSALIVVSKILDVLLAPFKKHGADALDLAAKVKKGKLGRDREGIFFILLKAQQLFMLEIPSFVVVLLEIIVSHLCAPE